MELAIHGRYATTCDRLMTSSTKRAPLQVIMSLTIWQPIQIEEATTNERTATFLLYCKKKSNTYSFLKPFLNLFYLRKFYRRYIYRADETIRMPLGIQCRNVVLCNWFATTSTFWCKQIEVILSTICFPILLMVSLISKCFPTNATKEVFRMPSVVQSSDAFLQNFKPV